MLFAKDTPNENIVVRGARVLDPVAGVDAVLVVVDVFAGARRFGCRVARHAVLHRREQLLPLGIGLDDFVHAETFGGDGVGPGTLPRAAGSKHASGYCRLSIALGINAFCGPAA